jgi:hypothetical protein
MEVGWLYGKRNGSLGLAWASCVVAAITRAAATDVSVRIGSPLRVMSKISQGRSR